MNKRNIFGIALAVLLLTVTAFSAEAATNVVVRNNGMSASASLNTETGGLITNAYVSVTKGNDGTYVDIVKSISDVNWNLLYIAYGQKFIQPGTDVFSMDKKLNKASLVLPSMDFTVQICDPVTYQCSTETQVWKNINVQWTGTGTVNTGSYKFTSSDGTYSIKYSDKSSYRFASATGSIDGVALGVFNYASMGIYKSAQITKQK